MLTKDIYRSMTEFNHCTNKRLLDLATKLTQEQWDVPQDIGRQTSLRETMFHVLSVEEEWIYFCRHGVTRFRFRQLEDFPNIATLQTFSDDVYQMMRDYVEGLDEEKLTAMVTGSAPGDIERTHTVWYLLTHMFFHSAQHRSEAAEMLTRFGQSPGFIDFYNYEL